MSKELTPRQLKRIESDKRIIGAATKVFGQKGYSATTLNDIAKEAGVTAGLIVQRFVSKEDLFKVVFEYLVGNFESKKYRAFETLKDALYFFIDKFVEIRHRYPDLFYFCKAALAEVKMPYALDEYSREVISSTNLYRTMTITQKKGQLPEGDCVDIFRFFASNVLNVIDSCVYMNIALPENETFLGIIHYRDEEIERKIKFRESVISAFVATFFAVFLINLDDNTYRVIKIPDYMKEYCNELENPSEVISKNIESLMNPLFREKATEFCNISTVSARLSDKDMLTMDYIGVNADWSRITIVPVVKKDNDQVTQIILGLRQIAEEEDYRRVLSLCNNKDK